MGPSGDCAVARRPGWIRGGVSAMASLLMACGGFLFAVLWMDLIFDVQVLRYRKATIKLPEAVLACIAAYYHRATTTSRPMNRLIALVMLTLLGTLVVQAARGHDPGWLLVTSAPLAGIPTMLALTQHSSRCGTTGPSRGQSVRTDASGAIGLPRPSAVRRLHARVSHPVGGEQHRDLTAVTGRSTKAQVRTRWPRQCARY